MGLYEVLNEMAEAHGFPVRGGLDIDSVSAHDLSPHVSRYDSWLEKGFDGDMSYLRRGRDRRADPRLVFPEAQSVYCVGVPYWKRAIGDGEKGPRYARYLKGRDYHDKIAEGLELLLQNVRSSHPSFSSLQWKVCVDTSAILERTWAALAGLGWIGKNTTLIHPKLGSYLFIAEVLLNTPLERGPTPLPNYCGGCTRCLDACPTGAFKSPGVLDARRCISYWTLEKRGELEISDEDRKKIGPWVAGCDICQEVCPFNIKPSREETQTVHANSSNTSDDAVALTDWLALLRETPDEYRARVRESALNRVKPAQFSRNLAIALANAGPSVWTQEVRLEVQRRVRDETDDIARVEWARCSAEISS